jgi:TldD protein
LYLQPGKLSPDDLLATTPFGIYAREFGGGKVSFSKHSFYFDIHQAYLVEKGKLSSPLGSLTLKGKIQPVLQSIDQIANDFRFDHGNSYCQKNGQLILVRIGQPSVKIRNLSVVKSIYD